MTRCLDDCFLFAADDPNQAADLVVDIAANRLPQHFGLDPTQGLGVLSICPIGGGGAPHPTRSRGTGGLRRRIPAMAGSSDVTSPPRRSNGP
jgi:hypothetical protein